VGPDSELVADITRLVFEKAVLRIGIDCREDLLPAESSSDDVSSFDNFPKLW
jgi:hypothetical protein